MANLAELDAWSPGLRDRVAKAASMADLSATDRDLVETFEANYPEHGPVVRRAKSDRVVKGEAEMLLDGRVRDIQATNPELSRSAAYRKALEEDPVARRDYEEMNGAAMRQLAADEAEPGFAAELAKRDQIAKASQPEEQALARRMLAEATGRGERLTAQDRANYGRVS